MESISILYMYRPTPAALIITKSPQIITHFWYPIDLYYEWIKQWSINVICPATTSCINSYYIAYIIEVKILFKAVLDTGSRSSNSLYSRRGFTEEEVKCKEHANSKPWRNLFLITKTSSQALCKKTAVNSSLAHMLNLPKALPFYHKDQFNISHMFWSEVPRAAWWSDGAVNTMIPFDLHQLFPLGNGRLKWKLMKLNQIMTDHFLLNVWCDRDRRRKKYLSNHQRRERTQKHRNSEVENKNDA